MQDHIFIMGIARMMVDDPVRGGAMEFDIAHMENSTDANTCLAKIGTAHQVEYAGGKHFDKPSVSRAERKRSEFLTAPDVPQVSLGKPVLGRMRRGGQGLMMMKSVRVTGQSGRRGGVGRRRSLT